MSTGKLGEDKACEYLVKNGYKTLKRNYKEKWDEIDIIGKAKDGTIVFFEVKTLLNNPASINELMPEDNLTQTKLHKLRRACEVFANKNHDLINDRYGWRIDLLALTINNKYCIIKHYENI